jgi:1,4-dihydroxy-2-naphthoate polyprenyltransferase
MRKEGGMNRTSEGNNQVMSNTRVWLLAARPRTLPAAAAPVIVGTAIAFVDGHFRPGPALAALLAAVLLQIGANIANDVFDYFKGADPTHRLGPIRVTSAGLLTPAQSLRGMWIIFGLAAILGLYLALIAGWPVVAIGVAAILAAIAYTGGPFPFGYYGLGDFFVFLFFGFAAVTGSYYVQALTVSPLSLWAALPMGFLVTSILVVNNLRDISTDREVGKKTLAVRFGQKGARLEFVVCLVGAYLIPVIIMAVGEAGFPLAFVWLSLPMATGLIRFVYREEGRPLNEALAGAGRLTLVYGILFGLGVILSMYV